MVRGGVQPYLLAVLRTHHVCRGGVPARQIWAGLPRLVGGRAVVLAAQPTLDGSGCRVLPAQRSKARIQRLLRHLLEPCRDLGFEACGARRRCLGGHPSPLLAIHTARYVHRVLHTPQPQASLARAARGGAVRNLPISEVKKKRRTHRCAVLEWRMPESNRRPLACHASALAS